MQFNVGDIVEHMVYGCGMVEELWNMNGTDYATLWVFDSKPEQWGWQDQKAEVMLKYLKPFVAHVET
jgi:hypothetical protein